MKLLTTNLILSLAMNGIVLAQTTPSSNVPGASGNVEQGLETQPFNPTSTLHGTVHSIDRSGNRLRVRDDQGHSTEYLVNDKTTFWSNGQRKSFGEINTGDEVTVRTDAQTGALRFEFGGPPK